MRKYNPELIKKISDKISKPLKYILEQISKRALQHNIAPEAELATWARSLKISADSYIRKLPDSIHAQIYSRPSSNTRNNLLQPSVLRIVQIGKKENEWYNQWWFQVFFAFFVVGITAGTIANILGALLINQLGIR